MNPSCDKYLSQLKKDDKLFFTSIHMRPAGIDRPISHCHNVLHHRTNSKGHLIPFTFLKQQGHGQCGSLCFSGNRNRLAPYEIKF